MSKKPQEKANAGARDPGFPANAFTGKIAKPTDAELAAELGKCRTVWDSLIAHLAAELQLDGQEWGSSSPKLGWSLRLKKADRIIVYLAPCQGCFMASFALGGKAVEAARKSKLPARAMEIIDHAKRYAEGSAVRIVVKTSGDAAIVKKLAAIKVKN